eukprot:169122-Pelagomonas_calceolata.AAC.2
MLTGWQVEQLQQQLAEARADNSGLLARLQEWRVSSRRGSANGLSSSSPPQLPSPAAEPETGATKAQDSDVSLRCDGLPVTLALASPKNV